MYKPSFKYLQKELVVLICRVPLPRELAVVVILGSRRLAGTAEPCTFRAVL